MKYKKLMLVSLFLLIVFSLGAASAADDNGTIQISEVDAVEVDENDDLKIVNENQELADEDDALSEGEKADLDFEIQFAKEIFREEGGEGRLVGVNTISPDYDGTFNISIDGKAAERYGDGYKLHARSFDVGLHNITVVSHETEKYNPTSKTAYFNVSDIVIRIPSEIVFGSNDYIKAYVARNVKGTLTVNVDGKEFKKIELGEIDIDPESGYTIRLNDLDFKRNYMIEVIYSGNNPSTSKKVNATATGYEITAYTLGFFYMSGRNYVHVILPKDAKGKPTVFVDGIQYACERNGTEYTADVNSLGIGLYNLTVGYEDEKYPYYEITKQFSVQPKIDYRTEVYCNNSDNITLRLPKDASGQLKVYLSDEYISSENESLLYKCVKLEDGRADVSLSDLDLGRHFILAVYDGDDYYVYASYDFINVKMNIIYPYTITYGDTVDITVISHQNDNSKLVLAITGWDEYPLQLVNGTAKLQLKKLPAYDLVDFRIYNATSDSGEYNYNNPVDTFSIEVEPKKPKMTLAKDISMYYYDGSKYSVKVYDGYDRPIGAKYYVQFKIGTSKYNRPTNANGVASLVISKLPGKYTISATFAGVTVKNKLTVKKVLTLKTVKVKKSAKKLVLSATLKKGKKAIKNTKVSFKFNGKTYSAKTNSKGIAKYTIKKSVLKKLKAGKKVKYQVTYKKCTLKKTATVKK